MTSPGANQLRRSNEGQVMRLERGSSGCILRPTGNRRRRMSVARPFNIPKELVAAAFRAVKSNAGGAGNDKETIGRFKSKLKDNIYKSEIACSIRGLLPAARSRRSAIPKRVAGKGVLRVPRFGCMWLRWWSRRCLNPVGAYLSSGFLRFFFRPEEIHVTQWRSRASVAGRVRSR